MNSTDLILLKQWQHHRDAQAFQELVSRHSAMVFSTCRRILQNASDAEEVAQECFGILAQAEIKKIRILGGWLHSLATSRSLDRLRVDKRRILREQRYAAEGTTFREPTWDDIQCFVDDAIETLPEDLSSVVISHFLEGQAQVSIGETLALSPSAVSRRIDRAVELIRENLKGNGITVGLALLPSLLVVANAVETIPKSLQSSLGKLALSGGNTVAPVSTVVTPISLTSSLALKCGVGLLALFVVGTIVLMLPKQTSYDPTLEAIVLSTPALDITEEPKLASDKEVSYTQLQSESIELNLSESQSTDNLNPEVPLQSRNDIVTPFAVITKDDPDETFSLEAELDKALDLEILHFSCENIPMGELTSKITQFTGVVFGFVRSPREWISPELEGITMDLEGTTARDILNEAIEQQPEYTWFPVSGNLVNLVPIEEIENPDSRLNTTISFATLDKVTINEAFDFVSYLSQKTVTPITGSVGGGFRSSGEIDPSDIPRISIDLQDTYFLDVINAISIEAGTEFSWHLSSKFYSHGFASTFNVVPYDLYTAREIRKKANCSSSLIMEKYKNALRKAPYSDLKALISVEYARFCLDDEIGDGKIRLPKETLHVFELLMMEKDLVPITKRSSMLSGYMKALVINNRKADARQIAYDLYALEKEGHHTFGLLILRDECINMEFLTVDGITRKSTMHDTLIALKEKRSVFSNDMDFLAILEKSIANAELMLSTWN